MTTLSLQPVSDHSFNCPHCKGTLKRLEKGVWHLPGGAYWLQDGEALPGAWERLCRNDPAVSGIFELLVGTCVFCDHDYYVVKVVLSMKEEAALVSVSSGQSAYFHAQASFEEAPQSWLIEELHSKSGLAHVHTFGPFPAKNQLTGPRGVTYAGQSEWDIALNLAFQAWGEAKSLLLERVKASSRRPA